MVRLFRQYNDDEGAMLANRLSVEEYLALDRGAEVKSEYHDGELFPIVAGSLAHSVIQFNAGACLVERLKGTNCRVAGASLRVRVSNSKYVYPDVLVYCGKASLTDEHSDTITNPRVIVEVLSPSTDDYDYGTKFILYRGLPAFEEYLLISQNRPRVEVFRKTSESRWGLQTYEGLESVVEVESLGVSIPMSQIYEGVELGSAG